MVDNVEKSERQKKLDLLEDILKEVYKKYGKEYKEIVPKKNDLEKHS